MFFPINANVLVKLQPGVFWGIWNETELSSSVSEYTLILTGEDSSTSFTGNNDVIRKKATDAEGRHLHADLLLSFTQIMDFPVALHWFSTYLSYSLNYSFPF